MGRTPVRFEREGLYFRVVVLLVRCPVTLGLWGVIVSVVTQSSPTRSFESGPQKPLRQRKHSCTSPSFP